MWEQLWILYWQYLSEWSLFIILTHLTKFRKFCVIEVFKFWVRHRYEENKEWQEPKLGDAQGTPKLISKEDSSA